MALVFPELAGDLAVAFDNAITAGAMQRDDPDKQTYWPRYEYLAYDAETGEDLFYHALSLQYLRVPRKEESE